MGDGGRAEAVALLLEEPADVIDGEVLLAGLDNLLRAGVGLGGVLGAFGRGQEEGAVGVLAEVVDQDAEAARGIAEAAGGLLGGESVDEEGAQGFVLAVGGVGGLEESLGGSVSFLCLLLNTYPLCHI